MEDNKTLWNTAVQEVAKLHAKLFARRCAYGAYAQHDAAATAAAKPAAAILVVVVAIFDACAAIYGSKKSTGSKKS